MRSRTIAVSVAAIAAAAAAALWFWPNRDPYAYIRRLATDERVYENPYPDWVPVILTRVNEAPPRCFRFAVPYDDVRSALLENGADLQLETRSSQPPYRIGEVRARLATGEVAFLLEDAQYTDPGTCALIIKDFHGPEASWAERQIRYLRSIRVILPF
jgi:hypothetical protein